MVLTHGPPGLQRLADRVAHGKVGRRRALDGPGVWLAHRGGTEALHRLGIGPHDWPGRVEDQDRQPNLAGPVPPLRLDRLRHRAGDRRRVGVGGQLAVRTDRAERLAHGRRRPTMIAGT